MTESAALLPQPFASDTYDSTPSHASPDTPRNLTPEGATHDLILDPALARWELSAIPFKSRSKDYIPPPTLQHVIHPYLACSARIENAPSSLNFVFCGFNFSSDAMMLFIIYPCLCFLQWTIQSYKISYHPLASFSKHKRTTTFPKNNLRIRWT
jgi:hypothetical protein